MTGLNERRKTKRIAVEIPLELITLPISIVRDTQSSRTNNISCSGLNCRLNQYISPFTHVDITLFLTHNQNIQLPHTLSFQGIVVRTERVKKDSDEDETEYDIAIFVPSGINLEGDQSLHLLKDTQQKQYSD